MSSNHKSEKRITGVLPVTTRILGIESSCDETAAAVVADGREILSSVVASQIDIHRKYGGVVPELASREHLRSIVPVVREALERAGMNLADLDAIGVTCGPGLVGSLLVGLTYGKVLAASLGKPLLAVNHLEGHVRAVFLEAYGAGREPKLPAVCLIVSGGHTILYEVSARGPANSPGATVFAYRRIGQTRDDAAGEAYDKVAKLLAFGYPGGPIIDKLAATAMELGYDRLGESPLGPTKIKGNPYDFSFSGIKTAVLYYVRAHPELHPEIERRLEALSRGERSAAALLELSTPQTLALLANFQATVISELVRRTIAAAAETGAESVLVSGGVAANRGLRTSFEREASRRNLQVFFPSRELSTDNAAMIAAAAFPKLVSGDLAGWDLDAQPILPLG
jgi:N6-L-threonylcarbamoyladenine synthase